MEQLGRFEYAGFHVDPWSIRTTLLICICVF